MIPPVFHIMHRYVVCIAGITFISNAVFRDVITPQLARGGPRAKAKKGSLIEAEPQLRRCIYYLRVELSARHRFRVRQNKG
jgi:hypothetical protein